MVLKQEKLYRVIGFVLDVIIYSIIHWFFIDVILERSAGFFVHISLAIIFAVGNTVGKITNNDNLPLKRTMCFVVGLGTCVLAYCILGDSINAKDYTFFIPSTFTSYIIPYLFSRLFTERKRKERIKFNKDIKTENYYENKLKEETNIFFKPVEKQKDDD